MPKQPKVPKPRFNLKNKAHTESLIVVVYRYNRPDKVDYKTGKPKSEKLVYSTGEKIKPKHWDIKGGRARHIRGKMEYINMNKRLEHLAEIVQHIFIDHDFGRIEIEDFKKAIEEKLGKTSKPEIPEVPFFQFIEEFIEQERTKATAKRGTWKKFITVFNHLKSFASEQGKTRI